MSQAVSSVRQEEPGNGLRIGVSSLAKLCSFRFCVDGTTNECRLSPFGIVNSEAWNDFVALITNHHIHCLIHCPTLTLTILFFPAVVDGPVLDCVLACLGSRTEDRLVCVWSTAALSFFMQSFMTNLKLFTTGVGTAKNEESSNCLGVSAGVARGGNTTAGVSGLGLGVSGPIL